MAGIDPSVPESGSGGGRSAVSREASRTKDLSFKKSKGVCEPVCRRHRTLPSPGNGGWGREDARRWVSCMRALHTTSARSPKSTRGTNRTYQIVEQLVPLGPKKAKIRVGQPGLESDASLREDQPDWTDEYPLLSLMILSPFASLCEASWLLDGLPVIGLNPPSFSKLSSGSSPLEETRPNKRGAVERSSAM